MNPAQKRTGLASAPSHDSQDVTPGARVAAQLDSSTLLPAPADPTTTVSRWSAAAVSRSCSTDLVTSVAGSVVGRNFVSANRGREATAVVVLSATTCLPQDRSRR
jgi:hypothetical protein